MKKYVDILKCLEGLKLQYIGRACNLVWVGFGDLIITTNYKGETRNVAKYAIHIQSPFRISSEGRILIASGDIYTPANDNYEDFNYEVIGSTLFDCNLRKYSLAPQDKSAKKIVKKILLRPNGDLNIYLEGMLFEIFVANSNDDEAWRFFDKNKEGPNLVVYGNNIELQ